MKMGGKVLYPGIALFLGAVFFLEIQMPLGFTPWLLYIIPLGLSYWAPYLYAPLAVATACTLLVVVGYVLSPDGVPASMALTNRAFGTVTFWALGLLILQYKILGDRLSQLTKTLATELMERTRDLGLAVSALQTEIELHKRAERDPSEARTELKRQVTNVLTAEGRRLQEQVASYEFAGQPGKEGEEELDKTRNELVQLGHRLEQLQRERLQDRKDGT
jgi:hypothetical protein